MTLVRIATRKSPLALWQANHIASRIQQVDPSARTELVPITTQGDRFLDRPLSDAGGKGLFVKEIEQCLLEKRAEVAVHSLKDLTSEIPDGLILAALPEREDPRDAFVSRRCRSLSEVPQRGRIGTSSLRRASLILERRPDLEIVPLRGNVESRLKKMEDQGLDGSVLALAGLKRLGLPGAIAEVLEPEVMLPAVGQGTLGVECRADDGWTVRLLSSIDHLATRLAAQAERGFLRRIEGGCTVPLAGYATIEGDRLRFRGMVAAPDGRKVLRVERSGPAGEGERIGREAAEELLQSGAAKLWPAFPPGGKP